MKLKILALSLLTVISSSAFAKLNAVNIHVGSDSHTVMLKLANLVSTGPISSGGTVTLSNDQVNQLDRVSGPIEVTDTDGHSWMCSASYFGGASDYLFDGRVDITVSIKGDNNSISLNCEVSQHA